MRSVVRAIRLLRELQDDGGAGLAALQQRLELPKPTLLRLLRTLESEKVVWRAQGDGLWRAAVQFRPSRILMPEHQRLKDVAMPLLESMRGRLVWPSDLLVRVDHRMILLETTRRTSGLAVNRDAIGLQIDMIRSAVGRAYLAASSPRARAALVSRIAKVSGRDRERLALEVETLCLEVRRRGYATRDVNYGGRDAPLDVFDDQLAAIAVPITLEHKVLGCINVVWLKRADTLSSVAARHLPVLRRTAEDIARAWAAVGRPAGSGRRVPAD